MKIPERFPIKRIEDYHTHHLGKFENGIQFFGTIAVLYRSYWLLVYLFDKEGNHVDTKYSFSKIPFGLNFPIERRNELDREVNEMVEEIGSFVYCDIVAKPFQIEIKIDKYNFKFGLIPLHDEGFVILEPGNTISFGEPWDGSYDT